MNSTTWYRIQKISTMVGAFLLLLPGGMVFLFGNLLVYVYSYNKAKGSNKNDNVGAPWLPCIYVISMNIGIIIAAYLESLMSKKITIILGILLFIIGLSSTYFTVKVDMALTNFTLGAISGAGHGFIFSMILRFVLEWAEESEVGLLTSLMYSSTSVGGIFLNQILTEFVNPNNLQADIIVGPTRYFSQRDVLHRVPNFFLLYSIISFVTFIIGFGLLKNKPSKYRHVKRKYKDINCSQTRNTKVSETSKLVNNVNDNLPSTTSSSQKDHNFSTGEDLPNNLSQNEISPENDIPPKAMLITSSFYSLWIAFFLIDISALVVTNYYKLFGQVWIEDDHFLTNVGTVSSFMVVIGKVLCGASTDKLGFKNTVVSIYSVNCLGFCFYYFLPSINKWLYVFATLLLYTISACTYTIFTTGVVKAFGKKHVSVNNGLLCTASAASCLSAPFLVQWLLASFGWFPLFYVVAALDFIGVFFMIIFLKKC